MKIALSKFLLKFNRKAKLPFFKQVLVADRNNWCQLDYVKMIISAFLKGFQFVILYNKDTAPAKININLDGENIKDSTYKKIYLWRVSLYHICVELQVFRNDIDLTNPEHISVIKKWLQKSIDFINHIEPYFKDRFYHKVIIQQGHLYDSSITRLLCTKKGIEVIAIENTLNKDRIIWDNISGISVNKNLARNFFWKYSDIVNSEKTEKYSKNYLTNIKTLKVSEHASPKKQISKTGHEKVIFFIGQVYTDASTLFGIYGFHSPVSIIDSLVQYAIKNDYLLIIKLHPKEIDGMDICSNRYDSITHRNILNRGRLFEEITAHKNIIYDYQNEYDTYSIIDISDICVTINSQAGLESLLFGKKVITCGNAFYDCISSVYSAKQESILYCTLDYLLKNGDVPVNMQEINNFFYIYCEKYCIKKTEPDFLNLILSKNRWDRP
jgi:hypothetical protein